MFRVQVGLHNTPLLNFALHEKHPDWNLALSNDWVTHASSLSVLQYYYFEWSNTSNSFSWRHIDTMYKACILGDLGDWTCDSTDCLYPTNTRDVDPVEDGRIIQYERRLIFWGMFLIIAISLHNRSTNTQWLYRLMRKLHNRLLRCL